MHAVFTWLRVRVRVVGDFYGVADGDRGHPGGGDGEPLGPYQLYALPVLST